MDARWLLASVLAVLMRCYSANNRSTNTRVLNVYNNSETMMSTNVSNPKRAATASESRSYFAAASLSFKSAVHTKRRVPRHEQAYNRLSGMQYNFPYIYAMEV